MHIAIHQSLGNHLIHLPSAGCPSRRASLLRTLCGGAHELISAGCDLVADVTSVDSHYAAIGCESLPGRLQIIIIMLPIKP
jgi:hypothetical protein